MERASNISVATAQTEARSMETIEFRDVEVLDAEGEELHCAVAGKQIVVPLLTVQPGSEVHAAGDRGRLVIPRWLAIGLGLLWPFGESRKTRR
jgi:hypothetical protein